MFVVVLDGIVDVKVFVDQVDCFVCVVFVQGLVVDFFFFGEILVFYSYMFLCCFCCCLVCFNFFLCDWESFFIKVIWISDVKYFQKCWCYVGMCGYYVCYIVFSNVRFMYDYRYVGVFFIFVRFFRLELMLVNMEVIVVVIDDICVIKYIVCFKLSDKVIDKFINSL